MSFSEPLNSKTHPLKNCWQTILRKARSEGVAPEWAGNFTQFATDVGVPDLTVYRLFKRDITKPLGPDNFQWVERIVIKQPGETPAEYSARQYQTYVELYPDRYRRKALKTKFDITLEQYDAMFAEQKGLCAICQRPEVARSVNKNLLRICVDHCHATGKVRALLCRQCNRGLGLFHDDVARLESAVAYLRKHA